MIRTMLSELTREGVADAAFDLGIETDQYIELFGVFLTRVGDGIRELSDLLSEADMERAARAIHSIKGTAQNMRLDMIAQPAIALENHIKGQRLEEATIASRELQAAFDRLVEQASAERIWTNPDES